MVNIPRPAARESAAGAARAAEVRGVARGSVSRALRPIITDTTAQKSGSRSGPIAKRGVGTASVLAARAVGPDRENARSWRGPMNGTGDTMRDHDLITTTRETISKGRDKKLSLLGNNSLWFDGQTYTATEAEFMMIFFTVVFLCIQALAGAWKNRRAGVPRGLGLFTKSPRPRVSMSESLDPKYAACSLTADRVWHYLNVLKVFKKKRFSETLDESWTSCVLQSVLFPSPQLRWTHPCWR